MGILDKYSLNLTSIFHMYPDSINSLDSLDLENHIFMVSTVYRFHFIYRNGKEVQDQPWGLQEPSGEECVVADSALQWQWNSVRCVISAHVVCERSLQRCPSPDINAGSYIKTSK